eukprot:6162106-Lingulodinium_polyedra.AAC.1
MNQKQRERARRCEGMTAEEPRAGWQEAVAKKELHQLTVHGQLHLVEPAPTEVCDERAHKWRRQ